MFSSKVLKVSDKSVKKQHGRYLDSSGSQNPSDGFHPASAVGIVELGLLLGHGGLSGFLKNTRSISSFVSSTQCWGLNEYARPGHRKLAYFFTAFSFPLTHENPPPF